jgi:hypothetical protein
MATVMTREQATAAVQAATARRDAVQANLLELDGSFGKRLLTGASLTGETRKRWDAAAAGLAGLWETFTAYSAVVDHAAEMLTRTRRSTGPDLTEIAALLTGKSVRLARAPVPLERRTLADSEHSELTLAAALREMERAFADAAEVVTSAESVWNEVTGRLDRIGAELGEAKRQQAELAADEPTGALAAAEAEFGRLRGVLKSDPLALWQRGGVDTARLDRLQEQTTAAASRVYELARLRDDAQRRITVAASAVAAARAGWQDAMAARQRAAAKIAVSAPPPLPEVASLAGRLAALEPLKAAGRWPRLAAELDVIEKQAAEVTRRCQDAERAAVTLLGRRDELRGLLSAYQAKAASLGAAEDRDLTARYEQARDVLWTAPCDLAAATDAVTGYQQAILALGGRGRRP